MTPWHYPLLQQLASVYEGANLGNVLLLACQHLLEPQLQMFKHLINFGLKPSNCLIAGKNYSTNDDVMKELYQLGCFVAPCSNMFNPRRPFDEWFESCLFSYLDDKLRGRDLEKFDKIIVLDDGGFMHAYAHSRLSHLDNVIGIEQTSSGFHKIQALGVKFESIAVARCYQKQQYESPFIGRALSEFIAHDLKTHTQSNSKALVFGMGRIGSLTAGNLNIHKGVKTFVTDTQPLGSHNLMRSYGANQILVMQGKYLKHDEAMKRIGEFDIIIGATGSNLFAPDMIESLHPKVRLISASSSDREFPSARFRQRGGSVHDTFTLEERSLANGGFPINFRGQRNEMPPWQIEFTMCLLMGYMLDKLHGGVPLYMSIGQAREMWINTAHDHKLSDQWYQSRFSN